MEGTTVAIAALAGGLAASMIGRFYRQPRQAQAEDLATLRADLGFVKADAADLSARLRLHASLQPASEIQVADAVKLSLPDSGELYFLRVTHTVAGSPHSNDAALFSGPDLTAATLHETARQFLRERPGLRAEIAAHHQLLLFWPPESASAERFISRLEESFLLYSMLAASHSTTTGYPEVASEPVAGLHSS